MNKNVTTIVLHQIPLFYNCGPIIIVPSSRIKVPIFSLPHIFSKNFHFAHTATQKRRHCCFFSSVSFTTYLLEILVYLFNIQVNIQSFSQSTVTQLKTWHVSHHQSPVTSRRFFHEFILKPIPPRAPPPQKNGILRSRRRRSLRNAGGGGQQARVDAYVSYVCRPSL